MFYSGSPNSSCLFLPSAAAVAIPVGMNTSFNQSGWAIQGFELLPDGMEELHSSLLLIPTRLNWAVFPCPTGIPTRSTRRCFTARPKSSMSAHAVEVHHRDSDTFDWAVFHCPTED